MTVMINDVPVHSRHKPRVAYSRVYAATVARYKYVRVEECAVCLPVSV